MRMEKEKTEYIERKMVPTGLNNMLVRRMRYLLHKGLCTMLQYCINNRLRSVLHIYSRMATVDFN